ncbi:MAG TPA: sulfotransferase domain-containing protein [Gammaproteobacteria bacterium]
MNEAETTYPQKSSDLLDLTMDSTRWNNFPFRDGDIVIGTWAKSGTTWTQQIVCQLLFNGKEHLAAMDLAPWIDLRLFPLEDVLQVVEAQKHRRFLKTHLPADALTISPQAQYIFLARAGLDTLWSWYHHHAYMTPLAYELVNAPSDYEGPPFEPPTEDRRQYLRDWLDNDGFPMGPFWRTIQSWWDIRHLPNVMLLHFNELKADMERQIRRIAEFLDIEIDEDVWPDIVEHCTFDYMKRNAEDLSPEYSQLFMGGLQSFVNKGTNGRWKDTFTDEDVALYEKHRDANLTADCAHWLETGEMR